MKRVRGNGVVNDIDYSMPSKTDQSMARETDVNSIMARALAGKPITHLRRKQGVYADISKIPDLMGVFSTVDRVTKAFRELPSELREMMANDPRNLPAFMENAENVDVLLEHGLIEAAPIKEGSAGEPPAESAKAPEAKPPRKSAKTSEVPQPAEE